MDAFINGICSTINGAPAYLRHHKRQVTTPNVAAPIPQLSFEKTRVSLQEHPFVAKAGIAADKIYRVMLAMLSSSASASSRSSQTPPPTPSPQSSFDEPPQFDPTHHGVTCERCAIVGMFERKRGSGGHTCTVCGHSNYLDLHRGDPTWHGVENERSHWEAMPSTIEHKDNEHISAIERIGIFIRASNDVQAQAIHILRSYRNSNNIASIEVVAAAALILATNTSIIETQTVTVPPRPEQPFKCHACNSRWSRKVDARICCRNGNNYQSTKVRRIHFAINGQSPRPEFDIDSDDDSRNSLDTIN
jgi:hypothetical protein